METAVKKETHYVYGNSVLCVTSHLGTIPIVKLLENAIIRQLSEKSAG